MRFPDEEAKYKFRKVGKFKFIYDFLVEFKSIQYVPKDFNIFLNSNI